MSSRIRVCLFAVSCTILCIGAWHPAYAKRFNFRHDIIFELHSNTSEAEKLTLSHLDERVGRSANLKTAFDYRRPTRIFIHGFLSNRDTLDTYAQAYRKAGDYNFIAINWLAGAVTLSYKRARDRVRLVGESVARLIDYLVNEYGMDMNDLVLVGHSLGAHACGAAGRAVKNGRVAAIVGLDPALPCYGHHHAAERLQQSDAEHVMVIHTNGGVFGLNAPLGHVDFYPNFGKNQPGCGRTIIGGEYVFFVVHKVPIVQWVLFNAVLFSLWLSLWCWIDICSHQRVHNLFIESLNTESSSFLAMPCSSYNDIHENRCMQTGPMELMRPEKSNQINGVFYLQTNSKAPYGTQT